MIKLGHKVKDTITSLEGIAIARSVYLNGCIQILIQPEGLKDGEILKSEWVDEGQIIGIEKAELGQSKKPSGGGIRNVPSRYGHS